MLIEATVICRGCGDSVKTLINLGGDRGDQGVLAVADTIPLGWVRVEAKTRPGSVYGLLYNDLWHQKCWADETIRRQTTGSGDVSALGHFGRGQQNGWNDALDAAIKIIWSPELDLASDDARRIGERLEGLKLKR